MNILVIGNGFDLAHGFKTSYGDYLDYVDDFNYFYKEIHTNHNHLPDISKCRDENNAEHFLTLFNEYGSNNEYRNIVDEQRQLLVNNTWIPYFRMRQAEIHDRWVDFEGEISRIVQVLDEVRNKVLIDGKKREYNGVPVERYLRIALNLFRDSETSRWSLKDIEDVKVKMLTDLNRLTRSYELYITSFIEEQDIKKRLPLIEKLHIDRLLSFNYSDTYEKWYRLDDDKIEYDYIHGKAGNGKDVATCNLVLGIDEYLEEPERTVDNEFIEFKKIYQRIYKRTGSRYLSWIGKHEEIIERTRSTTPPKANIYFYGHSLDITDGDIIAKLIRMENATTTIFYHNKKTLGDQITNLVKIIGEDELVTRTGDYKPSIIFKPCGEE